MTAATVMPVVLLCVLCGCSRDIRPDPEASVCSGELAVANIKQLPPWTYHDTDHVVLTVEGTSYRLEHFTHETRLCNSSGQATGFGTNSLILRPTKTDGENCDTVKVPQGTFKSAFRGDSLYLGPDTVAFVMDIQGRQVTDTMIYHFRLRL